MSTTPRNDDLTRKMAGCTDAEHLTAIDLLSRHLEQELAIADKMYRLAILERDSARVMTSTDQSLAPFGTQDVLAWAQWIAHTEGTDASGTPQAIAIAHAILEAAKQHEAAIPAHTPCWPWPCSSCGAVDWNDAGNKCKADWHCAADDQREIDNRKHWKMTTGDRIADAIGKMTQAAAWLFLTAIRRPAFAIAAFIGRTIGRIQGRTAKRDLERNRGA